MTAEGGKFMDALNKIMGAAEAAKLWGLSPGHIKNLAANGKIQAVKIGPTWVISKEQPNPKQKDD